MNFENLNIGDLIMHPMYFGLITDVNLKSFSIKWSDLRTAVRYNTVGEVLLYTSKPFRLYSVIKNKEKL